MELNDKILNTQEFETINHEGQQKRIILPKKNNHEGHV
jgi:hypothetical protein